MSDRNVALVESVAHSFNCTPAFVGCASCWRTCFTGCQPHHSSFSLPNVMTIFWWDFLQPGRRMQEGMKNRDFRPISCFISEMIKDSYYGERIGNRTQAFEWYHFQWRWLSPNPDFNVMPLCDADYLGNGTRYRHSYNEILIGTYALLKVVISNDLEWHWVAEWNIQWHEALRGPAATAQLLVGEAGVAVRIFP